MWDNLQGKWSDLPPAKRKSILIMASTALGMMLISSFVLKSRGAMVQLYADLPPTEAREIAAELSKQGIPFKVSEDESAVSVLQRQQARARMRLAAAGLPRSAPDKGWEIFGEGGLAVTKTQQQAMQIRALQSELARSIASLENVSKAAVHLSLKKESAFVEEQEPAKAAVLLHLKPSAQIDRQQALAIAHLVAKSVPDLETAQITIMDEKGQLLFSDNVATASGSGDGAQAVEREVERRVQSQLDLTYGLGKAIVRATAVIQTERSELRRLTHSTPGGLREGVPTKATTESEEYSGGAGPGGVGGVPGTAGNLFGDATAPAGGGQGAGNYMRQRTETDYKVNEEQEVIVRPGGGIQRMTVGIFVDESLKADLAAIETVARNAAGLDEERGDSLSVEAVKFAGSNVDSLMGTARIETIKMVAQFILNGLALIIGLLTLRSIIGALKPVGATAPGTSLVATAGGVAGEPGLTSLTALPAATGAAGEATLPRLTSSASLGRQDGTNLVPGMGSELFAAHDEFDDDDLIPTLSGPTPEELVGRVENTTIDDIAEVLRHWLEGDLDE